MSSNINIVLVNTSHPGNIGSTARAMKTMGLNQLTLVSPKDFPSKIANAKAVGCTDILDNVKVTSLLSDAVCNSKLIVGFSARSRKSNIPSLSIDDLNKLLSRYDDEVSIYIADYSPGAPIRIYDAIERFDFSVGESFLNEISISYDVSNDLTKLSIDNGDIQQTNFIVINGNHDIQSYGHSSDNEDFFVSFGSGQTQGTSENDDWFDSVSIKRNMKELKGLTGQFKKTAVEANSVNQRLSALYEDMGNILNRYYEIDEALDPVGKEDGDVDNDGDTDDSDRYLKKRRAAIGKAIKKQNGDK